MRPRALVGGDVSIAGRARLAGRDVADLGAEQPIEQRVGGRRSAARPLTTSTQRKPSLAAAAAVTRAWFDCTPPLVISVSALSRQRIRRHEPHLAHLVPAEREPDRIVALDEQARPAAERAAQARELLDGRGRGRERHRRQRGERAEHSRYVY